MFGSILVGLDGSPAGRDAIALATALAEPGARLTFAHVDVSPDASHHAFCAAAPDDTRHLLHRERHATGVRAELVSITAPSVGRGLHELAEARAVDLLVLGSCARGPAGRVLVGDDTRAALDGAHCAVAIAPLGWAAHPGDLTAIGVGHDFSDEGHAALAAARELAACHGARLRALHVLPQPSAGIGGLPPKDWKAIQERTRQDAERRLASIDDLDGTAVHGVAGRELAAFGDQVDLLIVGSRHTGPTLRLLLGSTSSHLARRARCPLLVLPRTACAHAAPAAEDARTELPVGTAS